VADEFSIKQKNADIIIREVATVTRDWRSTARHRGAKESEIKRMESAFEHKDLDDALSL
jgi:serine/threonine-protein kinase HipA